MMFTDPRAFSDADSALLSAEVAMAPEAYERAFRVRPSLEVWVASLPSWDRYGVTIAASSREGLSRAIRMSTEAHLERAVSLIWC
jgi:hypothetical protein